MTTDIETKLFTFYLTKYLRRVGNGFYFHLTRGINLEQARIPYKIKLETANQDCPDLKEARSILISL